MRKVLAAVCLVITFSIVADTASARGRIGRVVSSKPAPVKAAPKPEAAAVNAAGRAAAPRTWIVATPRPASQPANGPVAAADLSADDSSGRFAASWGDMPSAESSAPATATAAPPAKPESAPQAPTRVVALNTPPPSPKPARAAPAQPREIVVCYWNRAGQCVP